MKHQDRRVYERHPTVLFRREAKGYLLLQPVAHGVHVVPRDVFQLWKKIDRWQSIIHELHISRKRALSLIKYFLEKELIVEAKVIGPVRG